MDLYVEKHEQDDIIRYNLLDSDENFVFKTHAMLEWQRNFCPNVDFLVKVEGKK
jgi:hypothetical protein